MWEVFIYSPSTDRIISDCARPPEKKIWGWPCQTLCKDGGPAADGVDASKYNVAGRRLLGHQPDDLAFCKNSEHAVDGYGPAVLYEIVQM